MPPEMIEKTRQHRAAMDGSLSHERAKVDGELAARSEALREDADDIVKLARERAQQVLRVARSRADEAMAKEGPDAHARVAREREQEDAVQVAEQKASDATLSAERALRRQALAELLAGERGATDTALLQERAWADDVLQRREDMLAIVNHDFMNLASSVAMNAAAIVEEADEEDAAGRRIIVRGEAIRRATLQMAELASSLLDVASINAGALPVERHEADAAPLVREAVRLFEPVAAAKGLSLEMHVEAAPLRAMIDEARLMQVLTNLLTNAMKFTPAPGTVSVRAARSGSHIEFAVSDTGCGIPPEEQAAIFERFTRARGTRASGHGLGLYICKQIVAAHQAQLTVESEVGRGSTFKFRIAAAIAPEVGDQGRRECAGAFST